MSSIIIRSGNTYPPLYVTLLSATKVPEDLTGATVTYTIRNLAGQVVDTGVATVIDFADGIVEVPRIDLPTNRTYLLYYEVDFGGGDIAYFPNGESINLVYPL